MKDMEMDPRGDLASLFAQESTLDVEPVEEVPAELLAQIERLDRQAWEDNQR